MIDIHSYGGGECLNSNPRYQSSYLSWIGAAQVEGKPLSVSEWSVPYPETDRFTIAALGSQHCGAARVGHADAFQLFAHTAKSTGKSGLGT